MATFYVDPTNGIDSGARNGSSWAQSYASIQYCDTNATGWSITQANTIYLANTSASVLSATINTTRNLAEAPLIIEGADNGGSITATVFGGKVVTAGEINGNDAVASIFSNESYLHLRNLKMHSTTSYTVYLGSHATAVDCEIYNGASRTLFGAGGTALGCRVRSDVYTAGTYVALIGYASNCEFYGGDIGLGISANGGWASNCLVHDVRSNGIYISQDGISIVNCTVDGTGADSDGIGITVNGATSEQSKVLNCLIANFSGGTAVGLSDIAGAPFAFRGNNAYWNNTTNESFVAGGISFGNITETSTPFTNAASDDFSLVDGALSNKASMFNSSDSNKGNIGYWQEPSTPSTSSSATIAYWG